VGKDGSSRPGSQSYKYSFRDFVPVGQGCQIGSGINRFPQPNRDSGSRSDSEIWPDERCPMANSEADLKGARCLGYVQARMWSDIFK